VVTGLTLSFTDDHLEIQRVVPSNAPNLDHVDLASWMYRTAQRNRGPARRAPFLRP
jgi:hypothetical protein